MRTSEKTSNLDSRDFFDYILTTFFVVNYGF